MNCRPCIEMNTKLIRVYFVENKKKIIVRAFCAQFATLRSISRIKFNPVKSASAAENVFRRMPRCNFKSYSSLKQDSVN